MISGGRTEGGMGHNVLAPLTIPVAKIMVDAPLRDEVYEDHRGSCYTSRDAIFVITCLEIGPSVPNLGVLKGGFWSL